MVYCNKDIMDVMIYLEERKIEAEKSENFVAYLQAGTSYNYFIKGLWMAGMPEAKTLKLKRVAMKILEKKIEEADVNGKD